MHVEWHTYALRYWAKAKVLPDPGRRLMMLMRLMLAGGDAASMGLARKMAGSAQLVMRPSMMRARMQELRLSPMGPWGEVQSQLRCKHGKGGKGTRTAGAKAMGG